MENRDRLTPARSPASSFSLPASPGRDLEIEGIHPLCPAKDLAPLGPDIMEAITDRAQLWRGKPLALHVSIAFAAGRMFMRRPALFLQTQILVSGRPGAKCPSARTFRGSI